MSVASILIGCSEEPLSLLLRYNFEAEGFYVETVNTRTDLFNVLKDAPSYECVLIDENRHFEDIPFIVRAVHQRNRAISVVTLLWNAEESYICRCYDSGATNCIIKPFSVPILISVVRSTIGLAYHPSSIEYLDLSYDTNTKQFSRGLRSLNLTAREHDILFSMIRRPERVLTRENIQQLLWGNDNDVADNTVEKHISNLRLKLCSKGERNLILTVRGVGYRLLNRNEAVTF
jgi:DNA-binding response OmpR family regulator